MGVDQRQQQTGFAKIFLSSALAACIAEATTLPLDTAKVRLQLQSFGTTGAIRRYQGPFHTIATIAKEEGPTALFKGLVPGLHRQFIFTGLRLGLYEEIKHWFAKGHRGEDEPVYAKIAAALATSAIGITAANPSDVVKVRFQASETSHRKPSAVSSTAGPSTVGTQQGGPAKAPGTAQQPGPSHSYASTREAYRRIATEEGFVGGLYRGFTANLMRNCAISTSEIVTYDVTKHALINRWGLPDGLGVHLGSAITAGFMATVIGSPADVIGTRVMARQAGHADNAVSLPRFVADTVRREGLSSLFKGFWPNFARIGSFNIVLWLSYEEIKTLMGIPSD